MGRVNIEFASLTRVVQSASEGTNRADLTARGNHCPASLASTPGVWFHGPKAFGEKVFAKDYNSSLAAVHGLIRSTQAARSPSSRLVLVLSVGLSYFIPSLSLAATMRKDFESPIYRKSRLAARLILKARSGRALSPRQRQLAASLAKDEGVTPRLIQQGINQLCRKS